MIQSFSVEPADRWDDNGTIKATIEIVRYFPTVKEAYIWEREMKDKELKEGQNEPITKNK